MILSGFLAPDGMFTKCEHWGHLSAAENITNEVYAQRTLEGIQAEEYLLDRGYVVFYADGVQHRFLSKSCDAGQLLLLTGEQKNFIIDNLSNANNSKQKEELENLLLSDMEYQENSILSRMEERLLMHQA